MSYRSKVFGKLPSQNQASTSERDSGVPPAWRTARAAPVSGPPRHLRSCSHPPHGLYPAYTLRFGPFLVPKTGFGPENASAASFSEGGALEAAGCSTGERRQSNPRRNDSESLSRCVRTVPSCSSPFLRLPQHTCNMAGLNRAIPSCGVKAPRARRSPGTARRPA